MSQIGDKRPDGYWLARTVSDDGQTVENDYMSEDFGQALAGKLKDLTSGSLGPGSFLHYNNVAIAYTHLYGFDIEGLGANAALITRSGEQGSVAELRVPAAAAMLSKAWNIVVGPEITWSAVATTTDFASEAQAVTARNALQYYWQHHGFGAELKRCTWEAMGMCESAMHVPWDEELGDDVSVDPGSQRLVKTGDIAFRRIPTWDILRDPSARSHAALKWIIVREWENKYDVAATCETEDQKQAALSSNNVQAPVQGWAPWQAMRQYVQQNGDRIPVYYLYALRTGAVLDGRQTKFLQDGTLLKDGPLDERYVGLTGSIGPVVLVYPNEYSGTPWPYSKFLGTLGAGQARDGLKKDLLTNATAVCGPVISAEASAVDTMAPTEIGGGPRIIPRPDGSKEPTVLQLNAAHPDHFKLDGLLANEQQQIIGIDAITAGQDVGENLSGAAMALMTSTSVQNNSQEQKMHADAAQACGNIVLRHIQRMDTPRKIALAGVSRSSLVTATELSGAKVSGIERVIATIGPAMEQSDAGKYEVAKEAMANGWVKTPEQWQEVRDTGRLDSLSEDLSNSLLQIRNENEALAKGEDVPVMLEDDHRLHIKRHAAVVSSLTARRDPTVVNALQAHNDAHIRMLREADPLLLEATGQQPASMAPPPMPGATSGTPPPMSPQEEAATKGPTPPTNPATGEKAKPVAGAMPPGLAVKPN